MSNLSDEYIAHAGQSCREMDFEFAIVTSFLANRYPIIADEVNTFMEKMIEKYGPEGRQREESLPSTPN